jgi:hypothetical protein
MQLRPFLLLLATLLVTGPALAQVPLPRPRPAEISGSAPEPQRIAVDPAEAEAASKACDALLAEGIAVAERAEGLAFDNGCGVPAPVKLGGVRLADGKIVEFRPAALMRCDTALAVARWVREDLAPAAAAFGSPLARVEVAASYVCRPRNNVTGAVLSEHARGNALDVRALVLADNRVIAVTATDAPAFLAEAKRSACARFTTVLGPGADPAHEFHLHVDLAARRAGYRICQWPLLSPAP